MSKARQLADLGGVTTRLDEVGNTDGALSNRNMIINGGFTVWQRGTSGSAGSGFTMDSADRWYSVRGALSQETENSMPYAHITHGNYADSCYINHRIEDFTHTLGQQVTLSFKIKSDDGLGADGGVFVRYYTSSNNYAVCQPQTTFTYGSTWTTITYTFTMPTTTPKGAGYGLEFFLYGDLSSINNNGKTFDIKEVQFELGDTATPFEHRSYGDELARCQRYYQTNNDATGQPWFRSGTVGSSESGNRESIPLHTTMRVAPTASLVSSTLINIASGSPYVGLTTNTSLAINCGVNTSNSHFRYGIYWTADAEL